MWPNLRRLITEYKQQIEKLEEKIKEKTALLRHKIRHKTDKKVLLKVMSSRKSLEKKRDRFFDYQLQCEAILGKSTFCKYVSSYNFYDYKLILFLTGTFR